MLIKESHADVQTTANGVNSSMSKEAPAIRLSWSPTHETCSYA